MSKLEIFGLFLSWLLLAFLFQHFQLSTMPLKVVSGFHNQIIAASVPANARPQLL